MYARLLNDCCSLCYSLMQVLFLCIEGLQRPVNSPRAPRPRSMSEPSGFKRFMQRLSIRRKSRRPKTPKWKDKTSDRAGIESCSSAGSPEKNTNFSEGSLEQVFTKNGDAKGSGNHLSPDSPDKRQSQESAMSSSPGVSPSTSDGVLSSHEPGDESTSSEDIKKARMTEINQAKDSIIVGEHEVDARSAVSKDMSDAVVQSSVLSVADHQNDEDPTIWQRRSAFFPNTDDMIREGLMKTKEPDRRLSDPPQRSPEGNNNSQVTSPEGRSFEGAGIQARRNTSGNRGKRPMLTIEITPTQSGSEPSLVNQYVNLPEKPKVKQVARLQPGEWDRYDSEENVYHHLDKVIGQPGYQNVPGSEKTLSSTSLNNSYQNVAGRLPDARSYENVAGRGEIHYINVEAKLQQSVNYIKVAGSGPPTPIQKNPSFNMRKANPDYTEIDFDKTRRLGEMSRETKKERVERVKKT